MTRDHLYVIDDLKADPQIQMKIQNFGWKYDGIIGYVFENKEDLVGNYKVVQTPETQKQSTQQNQNEKTV